jgi:glycosyltransferase involved in cell wall biosynthesis
VTIHDLIHIRFTEYFSPLKRQVARALLRHACKASDAVIVDAEYTKRDILRDFDIPPEKIHPIHLGVSPLFRPAEVDPEANDRLSSLGLRRPYLLYSGALKRHKNLPVLFRAFASIVREHDIDLVLTGEDLRDAPELAGLAEELGIDARIANLGRSVKNQLVSLYQHALALVMPSLYEGFGLPVVEAIACGTPVVGANATTIPEILGDAGLLFDPRDPDDLARVLGQVLSDESLRQNLRQKGLARAAFFSWNQCADRTLEVYRSVGGQ